jgi:hypothetical protein
MGRVPNRLPPPLHRATDIPHRAGSVYRVASKSPIAGAVNYLSEVERTLWTLLTGQKLALSGQLADLPANGLAGAANKLAGEAGPDQAATHGE